MIDLTKLPPPELVPVSYQDALTGLKQAIIEIDPTLEPVLAIESDPINKLIEAFAYLLTLTAQQTNDAMRQTMLAYATGANLEHLGALFDVIRLEGEDDTRLRYRIQSSLEGYSTAGAADAYRYHAMTADARVKDVSVFSTEPGLVNVRILPQASFDSDIITIVESALNAEQVRPITDTVDVAFATVIPYQISATLNIINGPDSALVKLAAEQKLSDYLEAIKTIGNTIRLSAIYAALHVEGVSFVTLTSPMADITTSRDSVAICTSINLNSVVIE